MRHSVVAPVNSVVASAVASALVVIAIIASSLLAGSPALAAPAAAARVLVAPVQAGDLVPQDVAVELEEGVRSGALRAAPATDLLVMSHGTLVSSLAALQRDGRAGVIGVPCRSAECDAALGRALGTRYALSTKVARLDAQWLALFKLVDTADDRIVASSSVEGSSFAAVLDASTSKVEAMIQTALQRRASMTTSSEWSPPAQSPPPAPLTFMTTPPTPFAQQPAKAPECRMGTDGRQACGYHCRMGTDGVMQCADTPDGKCAMGTDGRVACSHVARSSAPFVAVPGKEPECRLSSRGHQTCGYNCRLGSNGNWYCASMPNGKCAMNSNGTWTCP